MSYGFQITNPDGDIVVDDRYRNFSFIEKRTVTLDSTGKGSFVVSGYSDISANAPKPMVFIKLGSDPAYIKSVNKATGVANGFRWENNVHTINESGSIINGMTNHVGHYYVRAGNWNGPQPNYLLDGVTRSFRLTDRGYHLSSSTDPSQYYRNSSTGELYGSISIDFADGFPDDDVLGGYTSPNNSYSTTYARKSPGTGTSSAINVVSGGANWTVGDSINMQPDFVLQSQNNVRMFLTSSDISGGGGNINNYGVQSGLTLYCTSVTQGWNVEVGGRESTDVECYVFAPTVDPFNSVSNDYGLKVGDSNGDIVFTTNSPQLSLTSVLNVSATWTRGSYSTSDYTNFTWTIPTGDKARSIPSGKMAVHGGTVANGIWGTSMFIPPPSSGLPYALVGYTQGISGLTVNSTNTTLSCVTRDETDFVVLDEFANPAHMYPYWNTPGTTRPSTNAYGGSPSGQGLSSLTVQEYVPVIDTTMLDKIAAL